MGCPFCLFEVIGYRRGLLLIIHSATRGLAFADILRYFDMLWVGGVGVQVLPCAEGASQTNIMIGVLGVRDIDTYGLVHKNINLLA